MYVYKNSQSSKLSIAGLSSFSSLLKLMLRFAYLIHSIWLVLVVLSFEKWRYTNALIWALNISKLINMRQNTKNIVRHNPIR